MEALTTINESRGCINIIKNLAAPCLSGSGPCLVKKGCADNALIPFTGSTFNLALRAPSASTAPKALKTAIANGRTAEALPLRGCSCRLRDLSVPLSPEPVALRQRGCQFGFDLPQFLPVRKAAKLGAQFFDVLFDRHDFLLIFKRQEGAPGMERAGSRTAKRPRQRRCRARFFSAARHVRG
jgi:hypothetical protein